MVLLRASKSRRSPGDTQRVGSATCTHSLVSPEGSLRRKQDAVVL